MRILLTNDDGIHSEGLVVLERIAKQLSDDVWIVAPETDQSGLSHSLTLSTPLRLRTLDKLHFTVRGTPTDCVIMGVRHVLLEPPDLILSGINIGGNLADDVTYSGTVAAAMEGTLNGIRSIALSQEFLHDKASITMQWATAEGHAVKILRALINMETPDNVLYNINFPACSVEDVTAIRSTVQGKRGHDVHIEERHDGRHFPYYWTFFSRSPTTGAEETDLRAIYDNAISVTPLHLDLTAYKMRDNLDSVLSLL
ncbi:5'/3'-nucleotidase SurE [Bartonella tamiae]|uniref:5'-nucleotidase SurE n=1 Tax=Bartonella tamiae Th239 TaxID=1094558 RepID=J1K0X4_9HYPH|nr:5'/3'-nucleotidase SurE [Bartonella tamiae]EJF90700.1 5'/3'-nucleotidase SurE [Bartonella tamiae Th239]EJF93923.1 5'/3'-nucleotidase SurE [Bartonella tamiae Th307]